MRKRSGERKGDSSTCGSAGIPASAVDASSRRKTVAKPLCSKAALRGEKFTKTRYIRGAGGRSSGGAEEGTASGLRKIDAELRWPLEYVRWPGAPFRAAKPRPGRLV